MLKEFIRTKQPDGTVSYVNRTGLLHMIVRPSGIYLRGAWSNASGDEARETPTLMQSALEDHEALKAPRAPAKTPAVANKRTVEDDATT